MSKRKNKKKRRNTGEYLTLAQAASNSGQTKETITALCESGELKCNKGSGKWAVHEPSLSRYWFRNWREDSAW